MAKRFMALLLTSARPQADFHIILDTQTGLWLGCIIIVLPINNASMKMRVRGYRTDYYCWTYSNPSRVEAFGDVLRFPFFGFESIIILFLANRAHQILLLIGAVGFSWLAMMLIHESGHALAGFLTGGRVQRMVWYPLVFSRTDVDPNPSPLLVVWAGPVVGALVPLAVAVFMSMARSSIAYLAQFFAGFCLVANGAYIGVGTFERVGDAKEMLRLGSPPWSMVSFGIAGLLAGFWMWHRASPRLGFGRSPKRIHTAHAYGMFAIAILIWVLGFTVGNRGGEI